MKKGTNPEVDSYSAFADNNQNNLTELYSILDAQHIDEVYVCGRILFTFIHFFNIDYYCYYRNSNRLLCEFHLQRCKSEKR